MEPSRGSRYPAAHSPGGTVVDVGTHIGTLTIPFAHRVRFSQHASSPARSQSQPSSSPTAAIRWAAAVQSSASKPSATLQVATQPSLQSSTFTPHQFCSYGRSFRRHQQAAQRPDTSRCHRLFINHVSHVSAINSNARSSITSSPLQSSSSMPSPSLSSQVGYLSSQWRHELRPIWCQDVLSRFTCTHSFAARMLCPHQRLQRQPSTPTPHTPPPPPPEMLRACALQGCAPYPSPPVTIVDADFHQYNHFLLSHSHPHSLQPCCHFRIIACTCCAVARTTRLFR